MARGRCGPARQGARHGADRKRTRPTHPSAARIPELDLLRRRCRRGRLGRGVRQRAGYADMAGAVFQVLAARPSDRQRDQSMEAECQTIAAAILALTDQKAASQMLRDLELRWGQRRDELGRVAGRRWLMAWALADPTHAEQLFEASFAALESQGNVNLQSTGVFKMAEVLLQPRQRREEFLRREIGATWYPGIDE